MLRLGALYKLGDTHGSVVDVDAHLRRTLDAKPHAPGQHAVVTEARGKLARVCPVAQCRPAVDQTKHDRRILEETRALVGCEAHELFGGESLQLARHVDATGRAVVVPRPAEAGLPRRRSARRSSRR